MESTPDQCFTFVSENKNNMEKLIKHDQPADTVSASFLTGAILFANLDASGLLAYGTKAAIGGAIWMLFKLAGDLLSVRMLQKKKKDSDDFGPDNEDQ